MRERKKLKVAISRRMLRFQQTLLHFWNAQLKLYLSGRNTPAFQLHKFKSSCAEGEGGRINFAHLALFAKRFELRFEVIAEGAKRYSSCDSAEMQRGDYALQKFCRLAAIASCFLLLSAQATSESTLWPLFALKQAPAVADEKSFFLP